MTAILLWYPKCSTCQKAKKWLDQQGIAHTTRHIAEETPTTEELAQWIERSSLPLKKFFNTSGLVYREMDLKTKLDTLTNEEKLELLAGNGMLIKRPIFVSEDLVLVGFQEEKWQKIVQ